ncbi:MAG: methyltransferase [Acidocella sp.]|nr:methyltransferase [Acidocella sp.]
MIDWRAWRDRLLASPDFQRWASRFFLTRAVARRDARALFDICAGFVYAQVLAACVELDLFERLAAGPMTVDALAAFCDVPAPRLRVLLEAADSLRLLSVRGASVRLGVLGAALRGNPGVAAMVTHHRLFYADVANPVGLLRNEIATGLSRFWPYAGGMGDATGYSGLMAATQPMIAAQVLDAYDVSRHECILDVGGGDGSFLRAAAMRAPRARLLLFDLPVVASQAEAGFAASGLAGRVQIFGGDFTTDALPTGADLVTLVRVLHDHDDAHALVVLRAARQALAPGGTLLLAEPLAAMRGAAPVGAAYFGFYLMAMGRGRPRSAGDIAAMLTQAGFSTVRQRPTSQPMLTALMVAQ